MSKVLRCHPTANPRFYHCSFISGFLIVCCGFYSRVASLQGRFLVKKIRYIDHHDIFSKELISATRLNTKACLSHKQSSVHCFLRLLLKQYRSTRTERMQKTLILVIISVLVVLYILLLQLFAASLKI